MHVRKISVGCAVALAVGTLAVAVPAHAVGSPSVSYPVHGRSAATWQVTQLVHGHIPGSQPGYGPDWGLTIDTGLMLAADGHHPQTVTQVTRAIARHVLDYTTYAGVTYSAATAKALVVADVLGDHPRHFGGVDLRGRTLKLVAPKSAGFEWGRLRDTGKTDYSNVFGQAYGVIGLARSGGVSQAVVDYLLKQRCPAGFFRLEEVAGKTCAQSHSLADVDATALALQALITVRGTSIAVPAGAISGTASWLVSVQRPNGSYGEQLSGPPDSNTTGLAAQALYSAGRKPARLRAASWVAGLQLTHANAHGTPARRDIGAIAVGPGALKRALKSGLGADRYQWQRATPQAYFAFVPTPLSVLEAP